jgi:SAM-dependent methyltransferase
MRSESLPLDHKVFLDWIEPGASVLDLGCGDGELLSLLVRENKIKAQGIEIDEQAIYKCVARGLSVFHQDIDKGLSEYADNSFDYVIPNFAHLCARIRLCFNGRAPMTASLPYEWHDTPNTHFLSIQDFVDYCRARNIRVEKSYFIENNRSVRILPNLFALTGIFMISKD